MSVALTYDTVLSRVRIDVTSIVAGADNILVERSVDQIQWSTVRGGQAVPVVASAASLDDYEFAPSVLNYYRVSAVDTGPTAHVNVGTAAFGVNASVVPGLPAALVEGDLMLCLASIRNSGTGTVNTPAGWTSVAASGNVSLLARRYTAGDTAPTITFAGGVALADTIAQIYARRNAELVPVSVAVQLNGSAQDIAYPGLAIPVDNCCIIAAGWKQDDYTSVATIAAGTEIAEASTTTGDDASQVWDRIIEVARSDVPSGSFVVTGGAAAISRAIMAAFRPADYITRETGSITPTLTDVWIKNVAKPFLNRAVTVIDFSEIVRPARTGVFDVIGRSYPVAVNDLHGSRRWTLDVVVSTVDEANDFDLITSSGEVLLVHVPPDCGVPGGYVTVGDTSQKRTARYSARRAFSLPLTEVAAPDPDVVGATVTWQGVLNTYATWADLIAAVPTWGDLLELIGSPSDVIVP
jgi:hypothetical protein